MSDRALWGQSAQYFVVKIAAAGISLLGFALFTRLLTTAEYGRYSLVITGMGLVNLVVFNWIRLGLLRFFPAQREDPVRLLSTAAGFFVLMMAATAALTAAEPLLPLPAGLTGYLWVGLLLLWAQAGLNNNLEIARAELDPRKYGVLTVVRALVGVACGGALAWAGFGAHGVLLGLAVGYLAPSAYLAGRLWRGIRPRWVDRSLAREMLHYGLPLSVTASLAFILQGSDRFMIQALLSDGLVGQYASGHDLGHHSLSVIAMTVGLAGTPLAINALEKRGWDEAKAQYRRNGAALLALSVPAAAGLLMVGPQLIDLLLGEEFRAGARLVFPWIVAGVLCQGIKFYFLDSAFYLHKNTRVQMWIVLPAALLNIALNWSLLPVHGIQAAAWSTALSYLFAMLLTAAYARGRLGMPLPLSEGARVVLAAAVMAAGLWLAGRAGLATLWVQVPLGVALYAAAGWLLGVAEIRSAIASLRARSGLGGGAR